MDIQLEGKMFTRYKNWYSSTRPLLRIFVRVVELSYTPMHCEIESVRAYNLYLLLHVLDRIYALL